jgi:hypothetical protein
MTASQPPTEPMDDARFEAWLRARASAAQLGSLRSDILAATAEAGQSGRLLASLRRPVAWPIGMRGLGLAWLVALLVLALTALLVVGPGRSLFDRLTGLDTRPLPSLLTAPPDATTQPTATVRPFTGDATYTALAAAAWTGPAYRIGIQLDCAQAIVTADDLASPSRVGDDGCGRMSWSAVGQVFYETIDASQTPSRAAIGTTFPGQSKPKLLYIEPPATSFQTDMWPTANSTGSGVSVSRCNDIKCSRGWDYFVIPGGGGRMHPENGPVTWSPDGSIGAVFGPIDAHVLGQTIMLVTADGIPIQHVFATGDQVDGEAIQSVDTMAFSPLTPELAFIGRSNGFPASLFIARLDTNPSSIRRATPADVSVADPVWSPDATKIALVRIVDSAAAEVDVLNVATGALTPAFVADGSLGEVSHLGWSADGTELVFADTGGLQGGSEVHVVTSTGDLLTTLAPAADPSWSPVGSAFAFVDSGSYGGRSLFLATGDGTTVVRLLDGGGKEVMDPHWLKP